MKILTDVLPKDVIIDNQLIPINYDFKCGIQFEIIMESQDKEITKIEKALQLYYEEIPYDIISAVNQMICFYGKATLI